MLIADARRGMRWTLTAGCVVLAMEQPPPPQPNVITSYPGQGYGFLQPGAKSFASEDWNTYRRDSVSNAAAAAAEPQINPLVRMQGGGSAHIEAGDFASEAPPPQLQPSAHAAIPGVQDASLPSWAVASRRPFPAFFAPALRSNVQHHMPLYAHHLHPSFEGHATSERAGLQNGHAEHYVETHLQRPPYLG